MHGINGMAWHGTRHDLTCLDPSTSIWRKPMRISSLMNLVFFDVLLFLFFFYFKN